MPYNFLKRGINIHLIYFIRGNYFMGEHTHTFALRTDIDLYKALYYSFIDGPLTVNMTKASNLLKLSQPAISKKLNALEEALGEKIYRRNNRGHICGLNIKGDILLKQAKKAVFSISSGERIIKNNINKTTLNIGVGDTICKYYLINKICELNDLFPNSKINILNPITKKIVDMLENGEIDIGVITNPIHKKNNSQITSKQIIKIKSVFICSNSTSKFYELVKNKPVSIKELESYPFLLLNNSCHTRQILDEYFCNNGVAIKTVIETECEDILLELARKGSGIAVVSSESAQRYVADGEISIINVQEPLQDRFVSICYLKSERKFSHIQQLIKTFL